MARLVLRGLEKRYDAHDRGAGAAALRGLELEVGDGELLVLVGPSGCGKSTALRLVAGLEEPSGGRIELDDRDLASVPARERDVAMVFQGYALYPHMTVREIIAFPLEMRGVKKAQREPKVAEVAKLVGLSDKLERLPGELSGGERQRVAMARAIVRSPKLFLFDEPLSNLDAKLRGELRVELVRLVKRLGVTAIYVTHDQAEAMTMGDRIAVLRAGELMQLGAPRELYETPKNRFVAGFIGTPPMNLFEVAHEDGALRAGNLCLPLPKLGSRGAPSVVGVRSEHVRVALGGDAPSVRAAGEVVACEPLGAESFVTLDLGGTRLVARVPGFDGPPVGAVVEVAIAPERLHYFDAAGERLSARAASEMHPREDAAP